MEKYDETDSYKIFQMMMSIFSSTNYTKSEFFLILNLIDLMQDYSGMSIEELSEKTSVSMAGISRFVKKCGFQNYHEFKMKFSSMKEISKVVRTYKYSEDSLGDITSIIDNITATSENIDYNKIKSIISIIKSSKKRLFIGSVEDLASFSRFRKDLFAKEIPCYFFYDLHTQLNLISTASKGECIILPTVKNMYVNHYYDYLNTAKKKEVKLILFTQSEPDEFSGIFDEVYQYGINESGNYGNYSLHYIAGILSGELYKK